MKKDVHYRDILRGAANGLSQVQIAKSCGCARSTVQDVLKLAAEKGVTWDTVAGMSEAAAYELVRGRAQRASEFAPIDFEAVHREMARDRTMTLTLLWEEYGAAAHRRGEKPYSISSFCEKYSKWCDSHDVAVSRKYVPGDVGEFDWAGKSMEVADELTGEVVPAWLFVACLPYSQMVHVAAYPSMDLETWCLAGANAFAAYGGVPRLLTIDNLKAGVTKHSSDELVLNPTYREFSEHFNVAVIPHAPRYPRGKASVESSVGKIANKVRNMLRDQVFFSFEELNEAIAEKVAELNARPFQKRAGTRESVFEEAERAALQPLPTRPFEVARWSSSDVTVGKGYHVLCAQDGVYYSVPYRYVGQKVKVRTTASVVEVYLASTRERIASHPRNRSLPRGEHVTAPGHRPKSHAEFLDHDSAWYRDQAKATGPACERVVEGFLTAGIAEEEGWRWCEKLLSKRPSAGADAVEEACEASLRVSPRPSYKVVAAVLRNRKKEGQGDDASGDGGPSQWAIRRFS